MNSKHLKIIGAFFALTLASTGCGGDDLFGTKCPAMGAALTSGTVTYTTVASQISDTCGANLTEADLAGDYTIATDTSACGVTVKGKNGGVIGVGTASATTFDINHTEVVSEAPQGPCQYRITIASSTTLDSDTQVTIQYVETDDNFMSLQGQNCQAPPGGTCAISYTLTMTKKTQ